MFLFMFWFRKHHSHRHIFELKNFDSWINNHMRTTSIPFDILFLFFCQILKIGVKFSEKIKLFVLFGVYLIYLSEKYEFMKI
jgi:hypothetical protein